MRDLKIVKSRNLGALREFNHLRVVNIQKFLLDYDNTVEYYKAPFEILKDLEGAIMYENKPPETIWIDYKEDGSIIFELIGVRIEGEKRVVSYSFEGSIS